MREKEENLTPEELEAIREWENVGSQEFERDQLITDPVAKDCILVEFISRSKGRNRKRSHWKEIRLLGYGGRFHDISRNGRGPTDEIATEVLGNTVAPDEAEREFFKRLGKLK